MHRLLNFSRNLIGEDSFLLLQRATTAFISRGVGTVASFVLTIVLSRRFGAEGLGYYSIAYTTLSIFAVLAVMGLDNSTLKYISIFRNLHKKTIVTAYAYDAILVCFFSSIFLMAVLWVVAPYLSIYLGNEPIVLDLLRIVAFVLPFAAQIRLIVAILIALDKVATAQLLSNFGIPAVAIVVLSLNLFDTVSFGVMEYSFGLLLVYILSRLILSSNLSTIKRTTLHFSKRTRRLLKTGLPTMGVVMGTFATAWACTFSLATTSTPDQVGLFRVAWQLAVIIKFFSIAIDTVLSPRISALYHQRQYAKLSRLLNHSMLALGFISVTFLLAIIFLSDFLLPLFGEEFIQAAPILFILTAGQVINSTLGLNGKVLVMTGQENKAMVNSFFGMSLVIVLLFLLVPKYGAVGAALAASLTMFIRSSMATLFVINTTGLNMLTGKHSPRHD